VDALRTAGSAREIHELFTRSPAPTH